MRYMCLIYTDQESFAKLSDGERASERAKYRALADELRATGQFLSGSELAPASVARTVRARDGRLNATDGPFAETREQLGGYFEIEARDIDEAVAIAARIPSARNGVVEVRELR